jgi:MFS family permease
MRTVWQLAVATALIVAAFAASGPVLAVLLQQRGYSTAAVGAFAMIAFACVGVLIPLMPHVFARLGLVSAYRWGCSLELLGALGYALTDSLLPWCVSAVLGGVGAAALWNATEALLAQNAPPAQRGHVMGLYQTLLGAALAVGPFAPGLLGLGATQVLWGAAAAVAIAWVIAFSASSENSKTASEGANSAAHALSTWGAMRTVPALVLIAFAGGVFEAGLGAVSAAHSAANGMSLAAAASVVGAIGLGSFAAQYPAGWLADRVAPRKLFSAAGLLLLLGSAGFAFAHTWAGFTWVSAWVWGGVGGALYTLSMIRVAHIFSAASAAGGTAAMITGYTCGGALGPLVSGNVLQWGGATGLATWLGLLSCAVLWAALRVKD